MTHTFYHAQPMPGQDAPAAVFEFSRTVPTMERADWLEASAKTFRSEGDALEAALLATLPGGTYDALLRAMLLRRASHLVVPFGG